MPELLDLGIYLLVGSLAGLLAAFVYAMLTAIAVPTVHTPKIHPVGAGYELMVAWCLWTGLSCVIITCVSTAMCRGR